MKRIFLAAALGVAALSMPAQAQVSVSIGQPGFYGRIDIGGFPEPALLYPRPVMIQSVPMGRPPLYLRVPPGHAKHWHRYCGRYQACGERVYFVRDEWYQREYVPQYHERHGDRHRDYREERRDERRDYREERHEDRRGGRDHDHGHGHGRDRD